MASYPQNHFQQFLQQPSSQPQQSKPFFRDFSNNNMEGQISQQVNYFNTPNLLDHHPPYVPPFQVAGLAPGPVQEENGLDLHWNFGLEPKKKRPREQVLLEKTNNNNNNDNNSQISSADLLQARSVSTGLGLSLENSRLASSGDSALLGLAGDDLDRELQRQDAEIYRYIKLQGDHLRQAIAEKFQANQLQIISHVEEKVLQKLREKEAEVDAVNKKNMELELRMEQVYAQSRDSKEGCGDSEVDDTASCCDGRPVNFHLLCKDSNDMKELMICKVCRVNEVSMLLLPYPAYLRMMVTTCSFLKIVFVFDDP
ncbi:hypothetical protein Sango_2854400 [Sesamum angolense]|uniref:BOI-related E3 ubiquitin-protein ligase 2 n=1 Tax=Sesamum angolense TaxID=2727404 RepID=A0AAE1T713_9LAMI|nr:hypothetical protein Sango_2854400 [Sesamum angolense]